MTKPLFFRRPFKYEYFHATLCIILLNFIAYFICEMFPNVKVYCALNVLNVIYNKAFWQFFSYMFIHQGMSHIIMNMLALFIFGVGVEKAIGSKEFLLFYFVCGVLSAVLSFAFHYFTGNYLTYLLGASGAVYAVLFAYAVCYPRSIIYIWGVIPVPAPVLVLIYAVLELVSELFTSSNIAHYTHLFGFLIAFLYFIIRMGINPFKIWKNNYKE